jgi:hypothetical protein
MEKKETPFQQILNEVMAQIKHDITDKEKCDMCIIDLVLNAHNSHYEHEEHDSGMVIYDINNQTDVQTCVNKGMGAHHCRVMERMARNTLLLFPLWWGKGLD